MIELFLCLWNNLTHWQRASVVLFLVVIFTLGVAVGAAIERHNWKAKAGRAAYFLALKMNERTTHR